MEKKVTFLKKSIKGFFLIGMTVQIVLGFCFMAANLFSVQPFADTAMYKEVSHTFLLDEYIGVLYPLILFLCPVETLVYLLQLAAAFLAGCVFVCLSGLGEERLLAGKNIFASLYLLTIPFLMQLHMAILPQSFVLSLGLVQLGLCMGVLRQKTDRPRKAFILCCLCLVGMALLKPDYLILGCPAVLWLFARTGRKASQTGKSLLRIKICQLVVFAGSICLVLFVNGITQTPGARGNIQRSLGAAMVSRLAWPNFEVDYYFWPEEVKEVMDSMTGREISRYAENVKTVLGPLLEDAFGKEQANVYYWQMAKSSFLVRTKEIVVRMAEDFFAYLFTPFAAGAQLSEGGASYSGYNFSMMWQQARKLTTIYVNYGVYSLLAGMVFVLAALIVKLVGGKKASYDNATGRSALGKRSSIFLLCVVCMLLQTVWYTMSGTYMMDYKNVPLIIALWYSCLLWGLKFYGIHTKDT